MHEFGLQGGDEDQVERKPSRVGTYVLSASQRPCVGLGTHGASEAGEDLGIDPVGLSELAGGCQKGNSPTVISNMG